MGNWRTVELKGKVSNIKEVELMKKYLTYDRKTWESEASSEGVFYLQFGTGLCGINQWVNNDGMIDVCGNVFERDCEIEDLESELKIIASRFPSLEVILHAGGDYESEECEASFIVKDSKVNKVEPMIRKLGGIDNDRVMSNLMKALKG